MHEPEDSELPWTEAQWEAFMERQDIRSAKYGELLHTFMDHPDCDDIIAKEMGWLDDEEERDEEFDQELVEAMNQAAAECDALSNEEKEEMRRQDEEELHSIAAYQRGYQYGLRVHKALFPLIEGKDLDPDDDFIIALRDSMVIAAKIAGGHGMGYDDDALCGNIVNCKRSLKAADQCLEALRTLRDRDRISPDLVTPLIDEGEEVRQRVEDHIANLRKRVWWE